MLSAALDCSCASFSDVAKACFSFEVGEGFDVLIQVHVASAEVPVRGALPRPVAHLCNRQVLRVVLEGLVEAPLRLIRAPEVRCVMPSLARSPTSFAIARCCVW